MMVTDRHKAFCRAYLQSFDPKKAAVLAGYQKEYGKKLLLREDVKKEIARQRKAAQKELSVEALDVLRMYVRIAFADISDYLDFGCEDGKNYVRFKDGVDGQLVEEVSMSGNVAKVKLLDRFKALEKLERFTDLMGAEGWKKYVEGQRLKLRGSGQEPVIQVVTGVPREKEEQDEDRE